jgi:hypothetical protein
MPVDYRRCCTPGLLERAATLRNLCGMERDELDLAIRKRAYEIWVREGYPVGQEWQHWERAEREVLAEVAPSATPAEARDARREDGWQINQCEPRSALPGNDQKHGT